MALSWPWRRPPVPPALSAALGPDELVQVSSSLVGGETLAVSRFGLWLVSGDSVVRWEWQHVSKARLVGRTLTVIAADELGTTDEGLVLLSDLPPMEFELSGESALTDAVHSRVRRSVAASSLPAVARRRRLGGAATGPRAGRPDQAASAGSGPPMPTPWAF